VHIAMIGFRGLPHTYGGGEEFVKYLAPGLVERGHQVTVYCRRGEFTDRSAYYKGVRRVFIPTVRGKAMGQFVHSLLAVGHLPVLRPDVVFIHTLPSGPHSVVPKLFGIPTVVNTDGLDWHRDKWGPIGKKYFRTSAHIVARIADVLISDAHAIRELYRSEFNRDSVFIAYGAKVHTCFDISRLDKFGLEQDSYYLIASRMVPENNADVLIDGFVKSGSKKNLAIAGGANFASEWVKSIMMKGSKTVRFLGHVSDHEDVLALHGGCYAYLHGHSLGGTNPSLLKALGCGNCVLALDTAFNREVLVTAGQDPFGLLFDRSTGAVAATIQKIEKDPSLHDHLIERARNRIMNEYSWEGVIDGYEKAFALAFSGERV
jgi:glycosyltransferase involved in cell wall biosynthesis